jgi:hypothetical protein
MKTIVLGDIHGRTIWKEILEKENPEMAIFIGDYVDTHDNISGAQQLHNLQNIIDFKLSHQKEVILLVGNHDHHYFPEVGFTGTSGYQASMAKSFEQIFNDHRDLFQMAYANESGAIFSHAGITQSWLRDVGLTHLETHSTVDQINDLFRYQPRKFHYYMGDYSGYGDNIHQSPIWVRPDSLMRDKINPLQVVGHTQVKNINYPKTKNGIYMIDALGSSREYLRIVDGEIEIDWAK